MFQAPPLVPGDAVGIAASSAAFDRRAFLRGLGVLERWRLKPKFRQDIFSRDRTMAGSHRRRLRELQDLIDHPDIKAIVFARGGFGLHHILPELKLKNLKRYPKRIIGYSDLTLLLDRIRQEVGLVSYYGPTLCSLGLPEENGLRSAYRRLLFAKNLPSEWALGKGTTVRAGRATGRLVGGCLTLLSMSLGTSFEVDTRNSLLLLEDTNEPPYRFERLLLHLKQSSKLRGVKGILLAAQEAQGQRSPRKVWQAMLKDVLSDFKGPVVFGFRFGHVKKPHLLPLGLKADLDTRSGRLRLHTS